MCISYSESSFLISWKFASNSVIWCLFLKNIKLLVKKTGQNSSWQWINKWVKLLKNEQPTIHIYRSFFWANIWAFLFYSILTHTHSLYLVSLSSSSTTCQNLEWNKNYVMTTTTLNSYLFFLFFCRYIFKHYLGTWILNVLRWFIYFLVCLYLYCTIVRLFMIKIDPYNKCEIIKSCMRDILSGRFHVVIILCTYMCLLNFFLLFVVRNSVFVYYIYNLVKPISD